MSPIPSTQKKRKWGWRGYPWCNLLSKDKRTRDRPRFKAWVMLSCFTVCVPASCQPSSLGGRADIAVMWWPSTVSVTGLVTKADDLPSHKEGPLMTRRFDLNSLKLLKGEGSGLQTESQTPCPSYFSLCLYNVSLSWPLVSGI